jgi:hypothetical protein
MMFSVTFLNSTYLYALFFVIEVKPLYIDDIFQVSKFKSMRLFARATACASPALAAKR